MYRTVNLVILCILLYALVFPFLSPPMETLAPALWRCQYKAATGEECPFCGLTDDMRSYLLHKKNHQVNPLFPKLIMFYFGMLTARGVFTAISFRFRSRYIIWADGVLHLVFLSAFFLV